MHMHMQLCTYAIIQKIITMKQVIYRAILSVTTESFKHPQQVWGRSPSGEQI